MGSNELKKIRKNESEYSWKEIESLHDSGINYENLLWHPKFDLEACNTPGKKFVLSIDLSQGVKGDFTVVNIFKLTPLPKYLIESIQEFQDEADFFGLVQVGIFRDNEIKLEDLVKLVEILSWRVFSVDRVKLVIEMNFKGELLYEKLIAKDQFYDEMFLFSKHTENSRVLKPGIKYNEKNKMKYCELLRTLIKSDRILINEKKWTVPELFTFGLNGRGTYSSQTGHDDVAMTLVNLPALFEGSDFNQLVGDSFDELQENPYKDLISKKINQGFHFDEDFKGPQTKDGKSYGDFSSLL